MVASLDAQQQRTWVCVVLAGAYLVFKCAHMDSPSFVVRVLFVSIVVVIVKSRGSLAALGGSLWGGVGGFREIVYTIPPCAPPPTSPPPHRRAAPSR